MKTVFLITSGSYDGIVTTAYAGFELAEFSYLALVTQQYGRAFDNYQDAYEYVTDQHDEWDAWMTEVPIFGETADASQDSL